MNSRQDTDTARDCFTFIIGAAIMLLFSGCITGTKAQLDGKLPRVDAASVSVSVSTIYGVSGTLTETDVKWDGDRKTVGTSELRITSPAGTYHRTIKGVSVERRANVRAFRDGGGSDIVSYEIYANGVPVEPARVPLTLDNGGAP